LRVDLSVAAISNENLEYDSISKKLAKKSISQSKKKASIDD